MEGAIIHDSAGASAAGHRHLGDWLRDVEAKWAQHASRRGDGSLAMTVSERVDHMRNLSIQAGTTGPRVAYTKAGTLLSAALVEDPNVIVDHKAYWTQVRDISEGHYLCAIVNSQTVLDRVIPMQPRGWRDPRDFDNLVWELPIPDFDAGDALHGELAAEGLRAELLAAEVPLPNGDYRRKRRAIRDALAANGNTARMEALVQRLLPTMA